MFELKKRWLRFTMQRAYVKAGRDQLLYGTGYVYRSWFGWAHIPVRGVVKLEDIFNRAATEEEVTKFGVMPTVKGNATKTKG